MNIKLKRLHRDLVSNVLPNLQTGDIILCSYKNIIVYFMGLFQSDKVRWGHCLIVKDKDTAWEAKQTIKETSIQELFKNKHYWKILRHKKINDKKKALIGRIMPILIGSEYSYKRIFLQAIDHIFGTNYTDNNINTSEQVCSSVVGWVYEVVFRYKFNGKNWMSCTPDDIEDDTEQYPDNWIILSEKLPKEK